MLYVNASSSLSLTPINDQDVYLFIISIKYEVDKWWELKTNQWEDFLIDPVLLTNIIRTVWLRLRRHTDENLGFKGLTWTSF